MRQSGNAWAEGGHRSRPGPSSAHGVHRRAPKFLEIIQREGRGRVRRGPTGKGLPLPGAQRTVAAQTRNMGTAHALTCACSNPNSNH